MTTPTPAAQKAAQAIAEQLSRTGWNIEDREKLQYAAIIDREMNQWQDISTAPLNEPVLGALKTDDGYEFEVMKWTGTAWQGTSDCEPFFCRPYYCEPTHWQPLPSPPPCTAKP